MWFFRRIHFFFLNRLVIHKEFQTTRLLWKVGRILATHHLNRPINQPPSWFSAWENLYPIQRSPCTSVSGCSKTYHCRMQFQSTASKLSKPQFMLDNPNCGKCNKTNVITFICTLFVLRVRDQGKTDLNSEEFSSVFLCLTCCNSSK